MSVQVGTRFRRAYADSNALWEVTKRSGPKVWEAVIVNEPIEINGHMIDGDYAGVVDVFREGDIENTLTFQQTWVTNADESDQWWASLPVGQVVHYHNGFDQFVRGEIVLHDNEKQMKPTALIGEWDDYDLPTRRPNGEEYYPYLVKQINKGEPSRPHASNMYEYPKFSDRGNVDPRNLQPLPITLPPMTPDEEEVARLVNVCTKVGEFLSSPQHQGGRVVLKAQMIDAIAALKKGLADG